jgi:hypothetical protein
MTPQILIDECRRSGIELHLDGGTLKLRGAPQVVAEAAGKLRPYKTELIRYLHEHASNDTDGFEDGNGRSAEEWMAMIKELDARIDEFCELFHLSDDARIRIFEARNRQSLFSIAHSLAWFRNELSLARSGSAGSVT